jgi:predicted transcriptional regulator
MPRQTINISLPADMARRVDQASKREHRTRSELVREALRIYLARPYTPTASELRAIEKGRDEIRRGDYLTLDQLHAELDRLNLTERRQSGRARPKSRPRTSSRRPR